MEEVGVEVAPLSEEEVAVEVAPLSEEEAEETREDEPADTPTPGKSRIGIPGKKKNQQTTKANFS